MINDYISDTRRLYQELRIADEHIEQEIRILLAAQRSGTMRLQQLIRKREQAMTPLLAALKDICQRVRTNPDDPVVARLRQKADSIQLDSKRYPLDIELLGEQQDTLALLTANPL